MKILFWFVVFFLFMGLVKFVLTRKDVEDFNTEINDTK